MRHFEITYRYALPGMTESAVLHQTVQADDEAQAIIRLREKAPAMRRQYIRIESVRPIH